VKISIISSPREIKHTCRSSRDGSVFKVTRPGSGVQFLPYTSDFSPFQRGQTGSDAHPAPKLTEKGRRFSRSVRSPGVKSTSYLLHPTSRIRICGIINLRPLRLRGLHMNLMEVIFLNGRLWDGLFRIPAF